MLANYHTHTARCQHAAAAGEEEYVRTAIEMGFEILGFADHSPYIFDVPDYVSGMRMKPSELPDYVGVLRQLREKYRNKIDLHIGLEAEYFPDLFPRLLPYLQEQGVEYLILGQHYPCSELEGNVCHAPTEDESLLKEYCHNCMEALNTGLFTYFAHPDVCHFVGADEVYTRYMRPLCREAKGCGIPLEINLLGIRSHRFYPTDRFWEIAAEEGCTAVLGWDAHDPNVFRNMEQVEAGRNYAKNLGLTLLEMPKLRSILK